MGVLVLVLVLVSEGGWPRLVGRLRRLEWGAAGGRIAAFSHLLLHARVQKNTSQETDQLSGQIHHER
jgi:hypothetical protein